MPASVTNIFRRKDLATMHPEVTGYILVIGKYHVPTMCRSPYQVSLSSQNTIETNKTKTCANIQKKKECY